MDSVNGRTPPLQVERTVPGAGVTCLAVAGEVDMATGDDFRDDILGALHEDGLRRLLVDLAEVRFIDSHGVAVLVQARRSADARGVAFAVVNPGEVIRSVLEMLGVYELLTEQLPEGRS